jgi:hypothetical protein
MKNKPRSIAEAGAGVVLIVGIVSRGVLLALTRFLKKRSENTQSHSKSERGEDSA